MSLVALALAIILAAVHALAGKLRFLDVVPRSRWLSFAGGISVAYVFVHLLPELAEGQESLEHIELAGAALEAHVWLIALFGLAVFYGLERVAKTSRHRAAAAETSPPVFWLHLGFYGLYNLLIGYLLVRGISRSLQPLLLFGLAMAPHFVVNDYGLWHHHRERYARFGRWVLSAAVVGGCLVGFGVDVSEAVVAGFTAFVGGGVVLNVLKEELPEERQSRFAPFAVGAAAYAALLIAM